MEIEVKQLSDDEISALGVNEWPVWEKEVSSFGWFYEQKEECLVLAGRVRVRSEEQVVEFGAGDYVVFPEGLACHWEVLEAVRKHYRFS